MKPEGRGESVDNMPPPTVLVLNTNVDTVEMLRAALDHAGFLVTSGFVDELMRGEGDIATLLQVRPDAILYDVAMPYPRSWAYAKALQERPDLRDVPFVFTSTNVKRLREMVAEAGDDVIEIVGKPYDLEQIVTVLKRATGQPLDP